MFVTQENVVKDEAIQEIVGGSGPSMSYFSLIPYEEGRIVRIIIGANPESECAAHFNKDSLRELIKILRKVQKAMKQ